MKKILTALLSATVLFFAGCTESAEIETASSIELSTESIVAGPDGGTFDVTITSSENWRVSGKCDWFTISGDSGKSGETLSFTIAPNPGEKRLTGEIKVFAGSSVKKISIVQEPVYKMTVVSEKDVNYDSDSGTLSVKLNTNINDFEYMFSGNGAEWVAFASNKVAFGTTILTFNISQNTGYTSRNTTLTIKGGDKEESIQISQEQLDAVITDTERIVEGLEEKDINLVIKSNIDFKYETGQEWITITEENKGETDENGLTPTTYKLHLEQAPSSRLSEIKFIGEEDKQTYLTVSIKQQNPNPVLAYIPDAELRKWLSERAYILATPDTEEVELLEPALSATELQIFYEGWNETGLYSFDGLEAFPKLEKLEFKGLAIETVDLTKCKNLKVLRILENHSKLANVILGSNPISELTIEESSSSYISTDILTISADNLTKITANSNSDYIGFGYEDMNLDVSGCPKLKELNAERFAESWSGGTNVSLKEIFISQSQKSAYDEGTLVITKHDETKISVVE